MIMMDTILSPHHSLAKDERNTIKTTPGAKISPDISLKNKKSRKSMKNILHLSTPRPTKSHSGLKEDHPRASPL
jgi:hypothetical protein